MEKTFALVDCNSFFCSCERLFRPDLRDRPIGVLSNNDGCFVSLTRDLKDMGIQMGQPFFQVKNFCERHSVAVFSANFSLYTNISDRVMLTLAKFTPVLEVYSVDEAFLDLTGFRDLKAYCHEMKRVVERDTGIPVSVGIAPTKTLAKVANHIAKRSPETKGIVDLSSRSQQDIALAKVPIESVWGIGRATAAKLKTLNIYSAKDFRDFPYEAFVKKSFTKVGLQRQEELAGKVRFFLNQKVKAKQSIISSRSFGNPVYDLHPLRESVANYVSSACEKLRRQNSVCSEVSVTLRTSKHQEKFSYSVTDSIRMQSATADTAKVIQHAFSVLDRIYRDGYAYKKAGICLSRIRSKLEAQLGLFESYDSEQTETLMYTMDCINAREGERVLHSAACGTNNHAWRMNRNFKSPRYVSGWTELRRIG